MPAIGTVARMLRRHRLLVAGVGVAIALGIAALNAHAALPEHHHHHGEETMCAASLSIAVAAGALALAARDSGRPLLPLPPLTRRRGRAPRSPYLGRMTARSRAGPPITLQVLRR